MSLRITEEPQFGTSNYGEPSESLRRQREGQLFLGFWRKLGKAVAGFLLAASGGQLVAGSEGNPFSSCWNLQATVSDM